MIHHPDIGGDAEIMKLVNAEYDKVFEVLKSKFNATAKEPMTETARDFRDIIDRLMKLSGLKIELCGTWLWITGETKRNATALKKAGCRWSKTKNAWYWRHFEKGYRRFGSKRYSLDDIREMHGSELLAETA